MFKNDECVGHGYVIWHEDHWHTPELVTLDGEILPEGWVKLVPTDNYPVTWNETKH